MSNDISRRRLMVSAGAAGAAMLTWRDVVAAWYVETPRQPAGPFYHAFEPMSVDNDLLLRDGKNDPADGEIIYVAGRIRDQTGKPIKGARVEIWQANAYGRYSHPRHENTNLKLDPNFLGFGHFLTGEDGAYRFRSIKPAPYPDSAAWVRPPHIHFAVFPPSGSEWTTQMYFAGEPLNENDFLRSALGSAGARKRVTVAFRPATGAPDKDAHIGHFDIVLGMPGVARDKA